MSGRRERRSSSKSSKNKKDKNDVPIKAEEEAGAEDDEAEVEVDEEYSPSSTNDTKKTRKVKESVIDHTYRDYSLVEVADEGEVPNVTGGEDGAPPTARAASSGVDSSTGKHSNFPAKLHAILSNPGYQHIICWMPHGRSWNIIDKYLLTTLVLPKFFAHGKFESFNRSVNGWGFKRLLREGPDKRTYYHECFLRGRPELTGLMRRLSNPGKRLPDKAGEPNFYEISRKYPLPELAPMEMPHPQSSPTMSSGHPPPPGMLHHPFAYPPHASAQYGMMYGGYHHGMSPPSGGMPPPSPASSAGGKGGQSQQQQQQQQMQQQQYWPGQYAPNYPPNPYGYYPYPQMMMPPPQAMGGAGGSGNPYHQGYYFPYQQPAFLPSPIAASTPNGAAAFGVAAEENSVKVKEEEKEEAAVNTDETNADNGKKVEEEMSAAAAKDDDATPKEEEETVEI